MQCAVCTVIFSGYKFPHGDERTFICPECARKFNCCQRCMHDLQTGLVEKILKHRRVLRPANGASVLFLRPAQIEKQWTERLKSMKTTDAI